MKHGFYVELEELQKDCPEATFGFLENTEVTFGANAFHFLHGCCDEFAAMLSDVFGYQIEAVRNGEGRLIHAYCVSEVNGEKAYIDIRGITTDKVLFFEEFENELTYYALEDVFLVMDDEGYELEAEAETWACKDELFEGDYEGWTDVEIGSFINEFRSYYDIRVLQKDAILEDVIASCEEISSAVRAAGKGKFEAVKSQNMTFNR